LQANQALSSALAAITAAVVGVVANLAVWFGLRVLFHTVHAVQIGPITVELPVLTSLDFAALALAALAAVCLFRLKLGVVKTLGIAAAAGLIVQLTHI
jgi:chromate transporter